MSKLIFKLLNLYQRRYRIAVLLAQKCIPFKELIINKISNRLSTLVGFNRSFDFLLLIIYLLLNKNPLDDLLAKKVVASNNRQTNKFFSYMLGDFLLKNRQYHELTESYLLYSVKNNCEINANFRLVSFYIQKFGYKTKKLVFYLNRMNGSHTGKLLNYNEKKILFLICSQQNHLAKNKLISQIKSRALRDSNPTLYFARQIDLLFSNKIKNYEIKDRSKMYLAALKNRKIIEQKLVNFAGKICIVGNAPTEIGTGNGKIIDSFPIVCRINNYDLSKENDYGKKVDLWCRVANDEVDNTNLHNQSCIVYASNNFLVKNKKAYSFFLGPHLNKSFYTSIPSYVFSDLIKILGCLPSTGLALAYWIWKLTGPIPKGNLFGFTHLSNDQNQSFRTHYYNDTVNIGTHIHHFEDEVAVMKRLIK